MIGVRRKLRRFAQISTRNGVDRENNPIWVRNTIQTRRWLLRGEFCQIRKYPSSFEELMSVRGFKQTYRCPECGTVVTPGQTECPKCKQQIRWDQAAVAKAQTAGTTASQPTTFLETKIEWGVFVLYVILAVVLGSALLYALSLGTNYTTFAGTIVTALTTIAGFAVGVNSTTPTPPTQK